MNQQYTEQSIRSLDWREHIRLRPGMYIGKLGDGTSADDGIYVLLKEVIDNAIDEYIMGVGDSIKVEMEPEEVKVRDYGRGIPLGKVLDCVAKINTGGKYDSASFKKSVGLNGVGTKAVNALSEYFEVISYREGKARKVIFNQGEIQEDETFDNESKEPDGTYVVFRPDNEIFKNYRFREEYIETLLKNYAYLNRGLRLYFNDKVLYSENGLKDLLEAQSGENIRYPIIHLEDEDIEMAMTHSNQYGESYYSFVNGQHTTQGGTHLTAFKEALIKALREFYQKDYEPSDIRASIIAAFSVRIQEPVFESQTKNRLGSTHTSPDGPNLRSWVIDFIKRHLDDYLHKNPDTAEALHKRIKQSEKERKEIAGIRKLASDRAKKANLHNKKLRDCKIHRNSKHEKRLESTLFITEGDSASGSITKARDPQTQAVFSLKGKPLNAYGLSKKVVYQNEEFNLLQHALNIEEDIENLRYNNIVIATDADVDGMHIRLLLMTFFLQFFPEIVKNGHLFILQTPLFRVRNKKTTYYCYDDEEKNQALNKLGKSAEITRFKGLGEISPGEFEEFIGQHIRLEPVIMREADSIPDVLDYYMGKNTQGRQSFIIDNLVVEKEIAGG